MIVKPGVKFAIIQEMVIRPNNLLKVSALGNIAGVSQSGYYNWLASEDARKKRAVQDQADGKRTENKLCGTKPSQP